MKKIISIILCLVLLFSTTFTTFAETNYTNFTGERVALVLGGGGLRGSYQAGVIKALEELGIKYNIVVGSSIGAINGGAVVQGYSADEIIKIWENIKQEDIYKNWKFSNKYIERILQRLYKVEKLGDLLLIGTALVKGQVDNSNMYKFIDSLLNVKKINSSNIDFYVNTIQVKPSLKYVVAGKGKDIVEYVKASSSAYPVFPAYKINGNTYIDGSYYNDVPIDIAFQKGATKVIAVDISNGTSRQADKYKSNADVIYIQGQNLGSFLDFSKTTMRANIKKGYDDTIKLFKK